MKEITSSDILLKLKEIYAFTNSLGQRSIFNKYIRKYITNKFTINNCNAMFNVYYDTYMEMCFDTDYIYCLYNGNNLDNLIYMYKDILKELEKDNYTKDKMEDLDDLLIDLEETENPQKDFSMKAETPKEDEVTVKNKSVSAGLKLEIDVETILHKAAREYLSSDKAGLLSHVNKQISLEASKLRPTQITFGTKEPVKLDKKLHCKFKELTDILYYEKQAFLVGPAGTGKTTLASQAAEALALPFGHMSCTAGMSEAHLTGRMIADGSYISSEFVQIYENGGVFLLDEIDAADPNTLLIINSALANGYMSIPNRKDKPKAQRHEDFYAICAANTWGNGSNQYSGRAILDSAFLDRFAMSKLEVDYDTNLERDILKDSSDLASKLSTIRKNIIDNRLRRILSTRTFVSASIGVANGKTHKQILDRFFVGWTNEEKSKAIKNISYA